MANKFDVKVNVEFNAIMGRLNNALEDFKAKLATVGDAIGNKNIGTQLSSEFEKTVKKLNELNNTNITPSNVENYKRKLAELQDRLEKLKELQKELANTPFSVDISAKKKELEDKQKQLQDLLNNNKGVNFRKSRDWFAENAPNLQEEKETYLRLQREIKKLTNEVNQADTAQKNYTDGAEVLNQVVKDVGDGINKGTDALKDFTIQAEKAASEKLANTIQTQVNRFIGLNAIWRYSKKYIQDLVKTYKEFDQSLVAIAAVTGQTRDQMWANIGVYNKMAQSLGTTTQEVINASKLYYQQGLTTTSVLKLTEETVKLATIAELDSADATEYLTTAMNGFKLSAEESTRVTDVWANLAAKTASDVDELAIAISKVASLAENAGMEIETASAFLNQMIETTREAPENLGTALKTIIARFQELKVSEEGLSDGVDANKVERALKSAGVALRGLDGQFRDFDDVILDLSSKWDTLDRNTQRYIATIAAGSRQQSRFIAMVSDYEGLLRNVNYAYDSLGSADAQMAVFQEGLAASTNRLQAAWEGLYTSWSKSATVISKIIDAAADFVSTLADLGAGWSAAIAGLVLLTVGITANAIALQIQHEKTMSVAKAFGIYIPEAGAMIGANIGISLSTAAIVAGYVALVGVLLALGYGIIKVINFEKDHIKNLEKEIQTTKQLAAQEKDRASSADVLLTELDRAKNSEEELENVRQKIIDQFKDEIEGIDDLGLSYDELIQKVTEYKNVQEALAAKDYISAATKQREDDILNSAGVKIGKKLQYTDLGDETHVYRSAEFVPVYKYKGRRYDSIEELVKANPDDFNYNNILSSAESDFSAKAIIDSGAIAKETDLSKDIIKNFISSLDKDELNSLFDDEGKINQDLAEKIDLANTQINNFYNGLKTKQEKVKLENLLSGSFENLNFDEIDNLINQLPEEIQASLNEQKEKIQTELTNFFNTLFKEKDLTSVGIQLLQDKLSVGAQTAFRNAFNSLEDDPMAQKAFQQSVFELIGSGIDPELITGAMIEALSGAESAEEAFKNLLDVQGELKDPQLLGFFNTLRSIMDDNNETFQEGMAVVDSYYDSMTNLSNLMKGDMNDEDFLSNLRAEAALLAEINGLTEAEVEAMLLRATIRNEEGNLIIKETAELANLANATYIASAATVEGKKAELEAYAAGLQATANYLYGVAAQVKAQEEAGHANSIATQTIINDAATSTEAMNSFGEAAQQAWTAAQGAKEFPAYNKITANLNSYTERLKDCTTSTQILRLANEAASKAITIRGQAAQLSINKLASTFDKAGKSAGGAAKETDKLKDALKDLQDQLKDTKDDAERAIDAVTDYLEEQKKAAEDAIKAAEDALEKERNTLKIQLEAYKEYLEQRQKENQDALELQAQAAAEYFKTEIEGIQVKIDALNDEAEAEDRILKLQKARDEYNRAQNSRTRLVLTKGAGWIFKSDQKQITDARKALNDVQREIQKAAYQDQINELQKQADEWAKIAEGITKSAEEIAKLAAAVDKFRQGMEAGGTGYADVGAYDTAVTAQQDANDEYQRQLEEVEKWLEQADWSYQDYMDDQARQQFLQEFMDGTVGEQDLQEKVTAYLQDMLKTEAYIEEQKKLIEKIEKIEAAYELEKAQLGLTKQQLKEAKKIRKAIEKAFDPESGDLGLGKGSSYYQEVVAPLVETVQKIAEELAKLEAEQGNGSSNGGGSGSGSSSSDGGGENQGTTTTSPGTTPGTTPGETSGTDGGNESSYSCNHNWVYDSITDTMIRWRCTKCGATKTEAIIGKGKREGPGEEDRGTLTPKPSIPSPPTIGTRGIGLPSMSTLSTSTPSLNKVTNTSSTTTINIGTLESSANDYNGLVNDLMRNSMIKQPI